MCFFVLMTIRKITVHNSVKHIPEVENTREIKLNTIKNKSNLRKQNKTFSKKIQKIC